MRIVSHDDLPEMDKMALKGREEGWEDVLLNKQGLLDCGGGGASTTITEGEDVFAREKNVVIGILKAGDQGERQEEEDHQEKEEQEEEEEEEADEENNNSVDDDAGDVLIASESPSDE